jgi:hypothetical protein
MSPIPCGASGIVTLPDMVARYFTDDPILGVKRSTMACAGRQTATNHNPTIAPIK